MPAGCEDEGAGAELAAGSEAEVRPKEMAADEAGAAAVAGASAGALVAAELEAEVAMVGSDKPPEPILSTQCLYSRIRAAMTAVNHTTCRKFSSRWVT